MFAVSNASRRRHVNLRAIIMVPVSLLVLAAAMTGAADAKGPGATYCFYKTCHRVKTLKETQALVGRDLKVTASHYDSCKKDRFNPCGLTSSGEPFFPERADNAASPDLPDGTVVMVWSKATKEAVILRINNAGPYWGNRKLDLSRAAARKLGIAGVGEVTMRVLKAPTAQEARYKKNRRYDPVPGPIGQFASLDEAHGAVGVMVAQGKADALTVAGLAPVAGGADDASALAPLVPRFALPKGALAEALIAQSKLEERVVTAAVPPSVDVTAREQVSVDLRAVTPTLKAARSVAPRRTRVRAIEVAPVLTDPLTAIAQAVTDLVDPPKRTAAAVSPAKRVRSVQRAVARVAVKAKPARKVQVAAAKPKAAVRMRVAAAAPTSQEFRAGHTTYAEDRYRKPVKTAKAVPTLKAKKARIAAAKAKSTSPAGAGQAQPSKQAGAAKSGKSAALKKGGWQSSAVFEIPTSRPPLTGRPRRIPVDGLKLESEEPREPARRVHPSALV